MIAIMAPTYRTLHFSCCISFLAYLPKAHLVNLLAGHAIMLSLRPAHHAHCSRQYRKVCGYSRTVKTGSTFAEQVREHCHLTTLCHHFEQSSHVQAPL